MFPVFYLGSLMGDPGAKNCGWTFIGFRRIHYPITVG